MRFATAIAERYPPPLTMLLRRDDMALILFNKPYQVLTAFQAERGQRTVREFLHAPGFHPAGRLDADSEGLLLLTDDGALQARLSHPRWKVDKVYYAQVEGIPTPTALEQLRNGVPLAGEMTAPALATLVQEPEWLWPRTTPIRFRKHIPTAWLELTIREGRNRQVRRMTAAVGHPTLRLIRRSVGPWILDGLAPGTWRTASAAELDAFAELLARGHRPSPRA